MVAKVSRRKKSELTDPQILELIMPTVVTFGAEFFIIEYVPSK